jgi:hypothetical protein
MESEETPSTSGLLLGRETFFWAIKGRFNRKVIPNRNGILFLCNECTEHLRFIIEELVDLINGQISEGNGINSSNECKPTTEEYQLVPA